jgi:hypothetical protein
MEGHCISPSGGIGVESAEESRCVYKPLVHLPSYFSVILLIRDVEFGRVENNLK